TIFKGGKESSLDNSLEFKAKVYYKPAAKLTTKGKKVTLKWKKVKKATKYGIFEVTDEGEEILLKTTKKTTFDLSKYNPDGKTFVVKAKVNGKWTRTSKTDNVKVIIKKR
ncbi:MAG: hypothetical protein IK093_05040, partial [Ruminiclostridium sp.]|nr:hypothetical protein [Ruminiclostridium sp.]